MKAVPVLSIKLGVIQIQVIRGLMLTAAPQAVAARVVKMTAELITPNVPAQQCMNGARQPKNASARRGISILVRAAILKEARVTAVIISIKNAFVRPDSRGVPPVECVSAMVPTGVRLTKIVRR